MNMSETLAAALSAVKEKSPLVHHLTNYVTVNDCANITIAIGASPVMADELTEVEEMVGIASALVLNIGTLNSRTIASMLAAGKKAKSLGIPVILDPVGVGATTLRTKTAQQIIEGVHPTVIRGNMSEIKVLAGLDVQTKGVDSTASAENAEDVAKKLASEWKCIVAITGKTDIVSDGTHVCRIDNGHRILSDVSGTGCMSTSLIGSYCGANQDYLTATVAGIVSMGLAGELAEQSLTPQEGIGTFKIRLLDSIYHLTPESLAKGSKVTCE